MAAVDHAGPSGDRPTYTRSAPGRARASTGAADGRSATTTSASASSRAARRVSSSGSPGPLPTRSTDGLTGAPFGMHAVTHRHFVPSNARC